MSEKQARILAVKAYSRWSPYLEQCCLLLSANESYERAAEDIEVLTGVRVAHSTQQRLVHRQIFQWSQAEQTVEEMSVDGGKVRLRTPQGQPSEWRDYKAVNLHQCCVAAFFQDNEGLVSWVNGQPLSESLTCLGDGHDGIWNIYAAVGTATQRREILDWYHLVENLGKVGGSQQRLDAVQAFCGKAMWREHSHSLTIGNTSESQPLLLISTSIESGSSTTAIIKPKVFPLVQGQSNQPSNKSDGASKYRGHSGTKTMCRRC